MEEQQSTTSSTEPPGDRGRQSIHPEQIHQIILFRDDWEMSWGQIAALKLKRSTVQTAANGWEKYGVFTRKIGRPRSIDIHLPQSIVEKLLQDSRLSIRADARVRDISCKTVPHLGHKMGYHFYDSVPVPPLGADARQQRIQFCQEQLGRDDFDLKPIIFTDESTVHQDLN
jgi:hypothetical protein